MIFGKFINDLRAGAYSLLMRDNKLETVLSRDRNIACLAPLYMCFITYVTGVMTSMNVQKGYCTWLCVSHLTSGVSVRPENTQRTMEVRKFVGFSLLQRSSTPSVERHTYSQPFSCREYACAL